MKLIVRFKIEKKTKNTVRYQELDGDGNPSATPLVGTLYIRKSTLSENVPQNLRVTIKSK